MGDNDKAIEMLEKSLVEVKSYSSDWTDDLFLYTGYIEDKLSLFYYYHKNDPLSAMEYCLKAIKYNPDDERLRSNLKFHYESFVNKGELK